MTQKEIARELNISRSTVSLALSGSCKIKASTSLRIQEYARRNNYQPDMAARSLVMQKTNMIGVMLPSFAHRFLSELSNEIFVCLNGHGYLAIFGSWSDGETYSSLLDSLVARRVDGIITYNGVSEKLRRLHEDGFPVVSYRYPGASSLSYIDVNRYLGGKLLTQHLLASGRRRIAFIGGRLDMEGQRFSGYRDALLENNLEIDELLTVQIASGEMKEGREGMRLLLERVGSRHPDAVMFHNDSMAIGGMGEALRRGIDIPGEMAIAGFDDIEEAQYCVPSLTTIRQPKRKIATALVKLLIGQIEEKTPPHDFRKLMIEPELIVRESSGACATKRDSSC